MPAIVLPVLRQASAMPQTAEAIRQAVLFIQATWIQAAQSGQYFHTMTGAYVRGLQVADSLLYPLAGNVLAAAVVNVAPHARVLEEGQPGYHLPSVMRWSQSRAAKRSKQGVWYLRVPFRHSTPPRKGGGATAATQRAAMPARVARVAARLTPTISARDATRLGIPQRTGQRLTAGPSRGQQVHVSGLTPYQPASAPNVRPGYAHVSIYEGLTKRGAAGHTTYMTWRTMTSTSPGWHIPARPGTHIAAAVASQVTPLVTASVAAAAQRDLETLLRQQFGGQP